MNDELRDEPPPPWRMVHFREYAETMDLTGKDLISLLDRPKDEVALLTGRMADITQMTEEDLPGDYVTTMTGEIADEIHEWPNATLGENFSHLVCKFRGGRLIQLVWKTNPGAKFTAASGPTSQKKPWWKVW